MALLEVEKELRGQGKRTDLASNEAKLEKGKATEIVSKQIGVSTSTFERAKKVIENVPETTKESLRTGRLSINRAYNDIKTPTINSIKTPDKPSEKVNPNKVYRELCMKTINDYLIVHGETKSSNGISIRSQAISYFCLKDLKALADLIPKPLTKEPTKITKKKPLSKTNKEKIRIRKATVITDNILNKLLR